MVRALLFVLLAAAGCGSDPTGSPAQQPAGGGAPEPTGGEMRAGGQTGMEGRGGCMGRVKPVPEYTREEVLELVVGHHETTLARRDFTQTMDADLDNEPGVPMTLDIVALPAPEPSEEESEFECVGSESSEMDSVRVEVHLRVSDPPFEVVFEERVVFLRPALAVLEAYFAPELARELGLLAVPHEAAPQPTGPPFASRPSNLMMFFDADGVRGEIMSGSGCGRLRFPAGRRCHVMDRALELDADARAALEGFADLRELPLRGEDGSMTTLSVELLREPLGLCANQLPGQRPEQDEFASRFRSLDDLRVRLRSGDRRINLALPATLSSIPDPHGGGSWTLHVGGYLPPASLSEPDVLDFEVGDGELAHVVAYIRRSMDGEVSAGPLQIGKIAREAGAPAVTGTIDGTVGGKEPTCFGTPTQFAVAFTPQ